MTGHRRISAVVHPPRSLRGRLVATYTAVAIVLAVAGLWGFTAALHHGQVAAVDSALSARAAPLAAAVRNPAVTDLSAVLGAPTPGGPSRIADVDSLTFILDPSGRVAGATPSGVSPTLLDVARSAKDPRAATVLVGGEPIRLIVSTVVRDGAVWRVGVGSDLGVVGHTADEAVRDLLVAVPALILLAAAGAWVISGAALRPVDRMRREARLIGEDAAGGQLSVPRTADELARLAETFNDLLGRLHRSRDRQRNLVADAGHELRTPLAVLRTELELADRPGRNLAELADAVRHARTEVERLTRLANDLLYLAQSDDARPTGIPRAAVNAASIIQEAIRARRGDISSAGISVLYDGPDRLMVAADSDGLRRLVDNLLANSVTAAPPNGSVTVTGHETSQAVTIAVTDDGPGFPPALLPDAFDRFTRADPSRAASTGGAGLGLAIVAAIAEEHGGATQAANRPEGGAEVSVQLPAAHS